MEKIPTAEKFATEYDNARMPRGVSYQKDIGELMIEFAKLHVKAALEAASQKALVHEKCNNYHTAKTMWEDKQYEIYVTVRNDNSYDEHHCISIDKESILNAYPENLII